MATTFPKLKLTYFNAAGRAEPTRIALRLGGIPFDDERLSSAQFAELKAKNTLPYGTLPVLEVDGETIGETPAIVRYAARLAGLYPKNDPLAALMVEEILTIINEVGEAKLGPSMRERDAEKKKAMREDLADELPKAFGQIEQRLQRMSEYPYFQDAAKVHIHEIVVAELVALVKAGYIDHIPTTIFDEYKLLNGARAKVSNAIAAPHKPLALSSASERVGRPLHLKLTYLDAAVRAEHIRLAFHIGGIAFEDERISWPQLLECKSALPFGAVPVLAIDGIVMAQSFPLLRYAGTLGGLYPVDEPLQAAKCDEILARAEDFSYAFASPVKNPTAEQAKAHREYITAVIPKFLAALDTRVAQCKQDALFVLGDKLTVADLAVFHVVGVLASGVRDFIPSSIVDDYTALLAVNDAVLKHPRVVDWYATRGGK